MSAASDPLDDVPEFSPVFPDVKTNRIAIFEVHRETYDERNRVRWKAVLHDFKPHSDLRDVKQVAGGGTFRIALKSHEGKMITHCMRSIDGPPIQEGSSIDDDEDGAEENIPTTLKGVASLITALGVGGGREKPCTQCAGMLQTMQTNTITAGEARAALTREIDDMRRRHGEEIDRLRKERDRLEDELRTMRSENAGYLRTMASSKSENEIVAAVKEMVPQLPTLIRGTREAFRDAGTSALESGAAKPPTLTFGGGKP
jgi:hypothetical protein